MYSPLPPPRGSPPSNIRPPCLDALQSASSSTSIPYLKAIAASSRLSQRHCETLLYDSAMPAAQTLKNHGRLEPVFHFFLIPVLLANIVSSIYATIHDWPIHYGSNLWRIVMSVAWFMTAGLVRGYANKNQDRIIRMEERLRYASLLQPGQLEKSAVLSLRQIIALRFASDAELPSLIDRALAENLTPKQIKQSIVSWRPDYTRV